MNPYLDTATIPTLPDADETIHGGERTLLSIAALVKYAPLGRLTYSWVNPDGSTSFASSEEPGDRLINDAWCISFGIQRARLIGGRDELYDTVVAYCKAALRLMGR